MLRGRLALRGAVGVLSSASVSYLVAVKLDAVQPRPAVLGGLVAVIFCLSIAWAAVALARLAGGEGRVAAVGEALVAAGLMAVAAGGLANWAFGMQGFVVLFERQPVRLNGAGPIGAFTKGPLADLRELELTIALSRLHFEPQGPSGFRAVSGLRILDAKGDEVGVTVERSRAAARGNLVFRQGSFGFAPRISVYAGDRLVRDAWVPFRTIRQGPDGIAFLGDFEVPAEKLRVQAALRLDSLNEDMKGHPVLELNVEQEGKSLGGGLLKPGFNADLEGGLRVVFGGLQRWSEIDLSRRTYPRPILAGLILLAAGAVIWPLAAWRRW
jgi:hypothetical protein